MALFISITPHSLAIEMESAEYKLEIEDIQQPTPVEMPQDSSLPEIPRTTVKSRFEEQGYTVKNDYGPFTFTINNSTVSFKPLHEESHQTHTISLHTFGEKTGYELLIKQSLPFQTRFNKQISATTCSEEKSCTAMRAAKWSEKDSYGLGYTAQGTTVSSDFMDDRFYRPFSSTQLVSFASSPYSQNINELSLSFRVHSVPLPHEQSYQGVVSIIALPKL